MARPGLGSSGARPVSGVEGRQLQPCLAPEDAQSALRQRLQRARPGLATAYYWGPASCRVLSLTAALSMCLEPHRRSSRATISICLHDDHGRLPQHHSRFATPTPRGSSLQLSLLSLLCSRRSRPSPFELVDLSLVLLLFSFFLFFFLFLRPSIVPTSLVIFCLFHCYLSSPPRPLASRSFDSHNASRQPYTRGVCRPPQGRDV